MDPILIQFFKAAVPGAPAAADPAKLQADAFKCGFIIHPDLLNADVEAFIARQTADPNATFYKRWEPRTGSPCCWTRSPTMPPRTDPATRSRATGTCPTTAPRRRISGN